jgi:hypothetical protein
MKENSRRPSDQINPEPYSKQAAAKAIPAFHLAKNRYKTAETASALNGANSWR